MSATPRIGDAIPASVAVADFSDVSNAAAVRRVCQLAAQGYAVATIAGLTGWHVGDVRRVLGDPLR